MLYFKKNFTEEELIKINSINPYYLLLIMITVYCLCIPLIDEFVDLSFRETIDFNIIYGKINKLLIWEIVTMSVGQLFIAFIINVMSKMTNCSLQFSKIFNVLCLSSIAFIFLLLLNYLLK